MEQKEISKIKEELLNSTDLGKHYLIADLMPLIKTDILENDFREALAQLLNEGEFSPMERSDKESFRNIERREICGISRIHSVVRNRK